MQDSKTYRKKPEHKPQMTDPLGKLPPRDIELEEAVLGALMIDQDAFMEVCDLLSPEAFYDPAHQKIYSAIMTLSYNQQPIDQLTVSDQLRKDGLLESVGGSVYLAELTSKVYSSAHVEYHARLVHQKYTARRLISMAANIETSAYDESNDIDDVLQTAEAELFQITQTNSKQGAVQIDPVISEALSQIQAAANSKSGLSGFASGYTELDKITGGWQRSDLVIIAARPAMGKTAFVLSMAKTMAVDMNIPVAIFTLEMSSVQLMNRIFSNVANLPGEIIKSGKLSDTQWSNLNQATRPLYGAPLYVDENPGLSIADLRTKARRLVREHDVKLIMIDYLQLMNASGMKFGSREQEVSMISRNLKALAKELNIPIIALSQLNRSTETREDKRPQLSDLRESGAIEQDADIVCFIHRQEYYTRSTEDKNGNNIEGQAELIIAKHRSGAVGTVKLHFAKNFARFENPDTGVRKYAKQVQKFESRMNSEVAEAAESTPPPFMAPSADDDPMPDIMPDAGETPPAF